MNSEIDILRRNNFKNLQQIDNLNNVIRELEETLQKLIKENEEGYKKYPANWEEKTSVSNTWLTCRDSYWSILNKLIELKEKYNLQ